MVKLVRHEQGFTLLEMLLVLMIVAITTLLASRILLFGVNDQIERDFFEQLHADIYYAQSQAIGNEGRARVTFDAQQAYEIFVKGKQIKRVVYPKTVAYKANVQQVGYIEFTERGSLSRILRHTFTRKNKSDYTITFHLGQGRQDISM